MVSMYSLYGTNYEIADHLFMSCSYANKLWSWLGNCLSLLIDTSSIHSILSICHRKWNSQTRDVILSVIANILREIWFSRNQAQFDTKYVPVEAAINLIFTNISLTGNLSSGTMPSDISDFMVLKKFLRLCKANKSSIIKEVNWNPPICNWIRCNTGGAAKGAPQMAACGGIFRDKSPALLGSFVTFLAALRINDCPHKST